MNKPRECLVLDFDGTLIKGNSLVMYVRAGLRDMLSRGQVWRAVKTLAVSIARKLRIISLVEMKRRLNSYISYEGAMRHGFGKMLAAAVYRPVAERVQEMNRQGVHIILATAAHDVYMPAVLELDVLKNASTPPTTFSSDYSVDPPVENRGETKAQRVLEWLQANPDYVVKAVFTDHPVDTPLLKLGGRLYFTGDKFPPMSDATRL